MKWRSLLIVALTFLIPVAPARADEDPPVDRVLLLVDTSGSMSGDRLREARTAIRDIVDALDPSIPFGLGSFADDARILVSPTTDRQEVLDAARALRASGDTALRDALAEGLALPNLTRIVVLSDGADTASATSRRQILDAIEADPIPIDVIAIDPSPQERQALESIASASGGIVITAPEAFARSLTAVTLAQASPTVSPAPSASTSPMETVVPASPAAPTTPAAPASLTAALLAVAVLIGVGVGVFAGWNTVEAIRNRAALRRVLGHYSARHGGADETTRSGLGAILPDEWERRIRSELEGADIPLGTTAWLLLQSAAMVLVFAVILLVGLPLPLALAGLPAGWLITQVVLQSRIQSHRRQFEGELADFLTLVASGLRSGLSLAQAVASGAQSGSDVLARQMRRATAEVALGVDLPDALEHVAERMQSADLLWAVQALRIQREAGGSLSGILDTAATSVRQRAAVQREVRTLSAEGRLSAVILMILPIAVFLFFFVTRRDYIEIFWTTPIGWTLLGFLVVVLGLGAVWMRRITDVDV